jgi:phage terminase large subunit-like protein
MARMMHAVGGARAGYARRRDAHAVMSPALQIFLERGHFYWFLAGADELGLRLGLSESDAELLHLHAISVSPFTTESVPRVRASGTDRCGQEIDIDWLARQWRLHRDVVIERARERFGADRSVWGLCAFENDAAWDGPGDWLIGERDGCEQVRGHDTFSRATCGAGALRCPAGPVPDGAWFDGMLADRATFFMERFCRQSKGAWAGRPVDLMPWQRDDLLHPVFGWRRADGTRLIRQAYCEIPKKNGKSTVISSLMPYMLMADGEGGPEVYTAGVDRQQASIVFNESARMVRASSVLSPHVEIIPSVKTIKCRANDGVMRALSADNETAEGLNISALAVDEVHAHRRPDLIDALRYGGAARTQSLAFFITTAGLYDPNSIGWIMHEQAAKLISGAAELSSFWPVIYAAHPDDDWRDPATWRKANPALGTIISEDSMRSDCAECVASGRHNIFRRYRLNIWTQDVQAWVDADVWRSLARDYSADSLIGDPCVGGLDLAHSNDLAAFVLVFPPHGERETWRMLSWHFMARDVMQRRSREHGVDYAQWERDGWIRAVPGEMIDLSGDGALAGEIASIAERYSVSEIAYDPYLAAYISAALQERHGLRMTQHRFGEVSMNAPMQETERMIRDGLLEHDGNPLMAWEISNVIARVGSGGLMKPDKSLSRRKIDGPVALIMAVGTAAKSDIVRGGTNYGFIVL